MKESSSTASTSTAEAARADNLSDKLENYGVNFSIVPHDDDNGISHCKTLIWEAKTSATSPKAGVASDSSSQISEEKEENEENRHFFFETVLLLKDRVDEELLMKALNRPDVVSVNLADQDKAESLTGFVSGTIPPVGHNVPLTLYVDEKLMQFDFLRLGSGRADGHDLQIDRSQMMEFSKEQSSAQVFVQPISEKAD